MNDLKVSELHNPDQYCIIQLVCTSGIHNVANVTTAHTTVWQYSVMVVCVSGREVFIINSGVDVPLVGEKLNSSSEGQETNKTTNYHTSGLIPSANTHARTTYIHLARLNHLQ